jgi:hypothetical protein
MHIGAALPPGHRTLHGTYLTAARSILKKLKLDSRTQLAAWITKQQHGQ